MLKLFWQNKAKCRDPAFKPIMRINTDRVDGAAFGWSEPAAWDAEAEFYRVRARV